MVILSLANFILALIDFPCEFFSNSFFFYQSYLNEVLECFKKIFTFASTSSSDSGTLADLKNSSTVIGANKFAQIVF